MSLSQPSLADGGFKHGRISVGTGAHVAEFKVEIALNESQRKRGLMFRHNLAPYDGMLFDFKHAQPISMWMKNTPLSLDMIFIDEGMNVVHIAKHTTPYSTQGIQAPVNVRYVLELEAGKARKHGIITGDRLQILEVE
ncbi:MAG: DUF192 domain-containing protein [Rickettsiales bacterium]|nr:DUF192 domain-containing protein [Rickettsiales bacterium]